MRFSQFFESFNLSRLKASKYTKKLVDISRRLLYRIYGVSADSNHIRLLRIKLSRNYRVSLGLWVKENGEVVVFFLVLEGGHREDYYQV